ncbi:MAG: metallophosphoesterase family protein [Acidimicrobiales bacterium]
MAKPAVVVVVLLLAAACSSSPGADAPPPARPVTFAAFGDFPYSNAEVQAVPRLIDDVNAANVEFSVFLGDLKGGGRCENAHYLGAIGYFDDFTAPLVYTPGDNEWTDCHEWAQDPLERLARIRQTMFATDQSFGKRTLTLEQQRPDYPENARWRIGTIEFVAVHIVGSNNNHIAEPDAEEPSTPRTAADRRAAEREYQARDAAGREWLRGTFARAITDGSAAVVIFMQADPAFDAPPEDRARRYDGFDALLETLAREATAYGKPVVLVHGDSHRYRVDRPFVPNLTRVEPYGSPDVGWVQVTVDPAPAAAEPVRVVPRLVGSFPPS